MLQASPTHHGELAARQAVHLQEQLVVGGPAAVVLRQGEVVAVGDVDEVRHEHGRRLQVRALQSQHAG